MAALTPDHWETDTAEARITLKHVACLSYGYPLVGPAETVAGMSVAGILDIGLMKLDAIISRGSRKDFYDLYLILRSLTLEHLLEHGRLKYEHARDFEVMAISSLVAFDNADRDREPAMLEDVRWPDVKRFFEGEARRIGGGWIREVSGIGYHPSPGGTDHDQVLYSGPDEGA